MTSGSKRSVSIVKGWVTSVKHGLRRLRLRVPVADVVQSACVGGAWVSVWQATDLFWWSMFGLLVTVFVGSVVLELVKVWGSEG